MEDRQKARPDFDFTVGEAAPPAPEKKQSLFADWRAAAAVLAAVVVLGVCLGGSRSLKAAAREVTEAYYVGVDASGYGIATDLDKIGEFSGNLVTVASRYQGFDAEIAAVQAARLALTKAQNPAEAGAAAGDLTQAVRALSAAMEAGSLSDADQQYRSELAASIESRTTIIAHEATDYNARVRAFNTDVLGAFPANALKGLAGIDQLEEYG